MVLGGYVFDSAELVIRIVFSGESDICGAGFLGLDVRLSVSAEIAGLSAHF